MCFNYRMGFEPEPSNNLGNEFLIILTQRHSQSYDAVRTAGLGRGRAASHHLRARRSKDKAPSGREALTA
jgi:hypothetical protein